MFTEEPESSRAPIRNQRSSPAGIRNSDAAGGGELCVLPMEQRHEPVLCELGFTTIPQSQSTPPWSVGNVCVGKQQHNKIYSTPHIIAVAPKSRTYR
jgi:hypothetical protein